MDQRRVLIHCNAGRGFGMGHLMRCLALAEEAIDRGWQVRWGGEADESAIGVMAGQLPEVTLEQFPATATAEWLRTQAASWQPDVLHLDTYWLRAEDVPRGRHLVSAMQDGGFGALAPDLAIDANLGAEERLADPLRVTRYLLGASAIPIRRQVRRQRDQPGPAGEFPAVLVVIGGTDPLQLTASVVSALDSIAQPLRITVVTPANQQARVRELAGHSHHTIVPVGFLADLPSAARAHHLVISAAGTSIWDFACIGVPTALIGVAENQVEGYQAVVGSGLALGLGLPPHADLAERIRALEPVILDPPRLGELADRGREIVDGLGAWRIVSAWEQLVDQPPHPVDVEGPALTARPATPGDAELLFRWRNDEATRLASRSSAEIAWPDHLAWLTSLLRGTDRQLLVVEQDGTPVGTIRWDGEGHHSWEVSITVAPEARGRRLAVPILRAGERALPDPGTAHLRAAIHLDNTPSRRLFAAAGYLPYLPPDGDGFLTAARWRVAPND